MNSNIIWKPGKIRVLDDNKGELKGTKAEEIFFNKQKSNSEAKSFLEKIKANPSKRFLVIGRVQSGKTQFFLDLIYHSFLANQFNVVIIFCGVTNKLKVQTSERLEEFFKGEKQVINEVIQDWKEFYSSVKNKIFEEFNLLAGVEVDKLVLLTVKSPNNLKKIKEKIQLFRGKKILIIDDEADQASLNTSKTKIGRKPTTVNRQIVGTLENLSRESIVFNYVGITATPYANVFLEATDPLSINFTWLLSPKEGYIGLEEICAPDKNGDFFVLLDESEKDDWKNLKKAINTYLIGSMLSELSSTEMLIHTDHAIIEHKKTAEIVEDYVNQLKNCSGKTNPFSADYGWLADQMKEGLEIYQHSMSEVTGKQKEIFLSIVKNVGIKIVNSNSSSEDNRYSFTICIGGKMFERGSTLDHLLVSFFTKKNNNLDHTIQRCRWFGYREKYLKWMKIFTTIDTRQLLEDAWYADKEFMNNLPEDGENEQELKLYLPKKMKPFRSGIVDLHYIKENYNSKFKQEKICKDFEKNRKTEEETTLEDEWSFWEKLNKEAKISNNYPKIIKEIEKDNFYQLNEYAGEEVWEQIIKKCSNFELQKEYKIRKLIEEANTWSGETLGIKILLMRPEQQFSERTIFGKKPKINVFVGPDKSSDGRYPGDEKLFDPFPENKNKVLLYIYKVKVMEVTEKMGGKDKKEIGKDIFYALKFPNLLGLIGEEKGHYLRISKKNE